jgi:hypothetical protein
MVMKKSNSEISKVYRFTRKEIDNISKTICSEVAKGRPVAKIIDEQKNILIEQGKDPKYFPSYGTFNRWLSLYPELYELFLQAKSDAADYLAEEIILIADEPVKGMDQVSRNKLRVDTRKWIASKLKPKKYGERQQLDVTIEEKLSDEELDRRLSMLFKRTGMTPLDLQAYVQRSAIPAPSPAPDTTEQEEE